MNKFIEVLKENKKTIIKGTLIAGGVLLGGIVSKMISGNESDEVFVEYEIEDINEESQIEE